MTHGDKKPLGHAFPYDWEACIYKPPGLQLQFLVMPRKNIEQDDLRSLLNLTSAWITSRNKLLNYAGKLHLMVDGYNDDPRDLDQVPEVRAYFERIEREWPYLPFFLRHDEPTQMIYWSLVADGQRNPDGTRGTQFRRASILLEKVQRFFEEMPPVLTALGAVRGDAEFESLDVLSAEMTRILGTGEPTFRHDS